MKCHKCGQERSFLKRQNATGKPGVFWCTTCLGEATNVKGEDMSVEKQLEHWVRGWSVHNSRFDECCPDFSCCKPHLKWPRARRQQFAEAYIEEDDDTTGMMMMEALADLVGEEAHVIGPQGMEQR